jgi:hypothetical protein
VKLGSTYFPPINSIIFQMLLNTAINSAGNSLENITTGTTIKNFSNAFKFQ